MFCGHERSFVSVEVGETVRTTLKSPASEREAQRQSHCVKMVLVRRERRDGPVQMTGLTLSSERMCGKKSAFQSLRRSSFLKRSPELGT